MATIYMRIDGMKGDASHQTQAASTDEYTILSFETNMENPNSIGLASGGGGGGKAKFSPLTVKRPYHAESSVDLNMKMALGTPIATVEIAVYSIGGQTSRDERIVSKFQVGTAFVTSIKISYEEDQIMEEIEFTYGKMKWYVPKAGEPITSQTVGKGWDMTKNIPT